ncbi:MAG: DUF350 domain-containing protein, partial [Thiovulaceae bacterium]|nr:DUF350 domain-containing protein [Sulfurimonadaceae bacterium]
MDYSFLTATTLQLGINLIYTVLAIFIGIIALKYIDRWLLKTIDLENEIKKGNIAAAIFASTILLFIAIIIA